MARRNTRISFSRRSTVVSRFLRIFYQPKCQQPQRLRLERLEDRWVLNGDNALAVALTPPADVESPALVADMAPIAGAASQSATDLPARFESTAELEAWLIEAAVDQWGYLFGQTTYYPDWYWGGGIFFGDFLMAPVADATVFNTDSAPFSETNVQVDGVDEADRVETDGEFLYILSGKDLVIVKAGIGDELQVASRVELEAEPIGMYLSGNRLAIVSSTGQQGYDFGWPIPLLATDAIDYPEYQPPKTTVTVLDVTDRSAPALVQKSQMDGTLISSRVVDGELRLVVSNTINLPRPNARPVEGTVDPIDPVGTQEGTLAAPIGDIWYPEGGTQYIYETQEEYLARVKDEILQSAMPGLTIVGLDGNVVDERLLVEATDIYRPEFFGNRFLTTIATFELAGNAPGPTSTASIIAGHTAQVYATKDSIYLFSSGIHDVWSGAWSPTTGIYRFDFSAESPGVSLAAKGEVAGSLLNQFAADEHEGYLRVVTTPDWGVGQSVYVFEQMGARLEVVGSVDGIAPGEQIYSVRFIGERAFFVTFLQVDPLFALDMSDPANPKVLGELKIPGYSDYLQPIGENQLLAIGRGADESTGLFQELQVSIFDVTDLTDPQLVDRYSFAGGRSTATPATGDRWQRGDGDHHAVSYFPSEQIFALPIYSADPSMFWWPGIDDTPIFEPGMGGLQVFRIDVDAGFVPIGLIAHDTLVERSVRIGGHLYAISSDTVSVHELTDPTVQLGELDIAAAMQQPPTELTQFRLLHRPFDMRPAGRSAFHPSGELGTRGADSQERPSIRPTFDLGSAAEILVRGNPSRRSAFSSDAVFSAADSQGLLVLSGAAALAAEEISPLGAPAGDDSMDAALAGIGADGWDNLADDLVHVLVE